MPTITNFGDVVTTGNAVVQGAGTSSFAGLVTFAQGFTTPTNVTVSSTLNSTNVVATGNVSGANLSSSGNIWASSNVNGANVFATGNISSANVFASGSLYGANVASGGLTSNTANTVITSTLNLLSGLLISGSVALPEQTIITTGVGAGVQWGTIIGSQWTTAGADIYFATGKVAIGTSTVTYPLTVSGTGASAAAPYSNLAYQVDGWAQAYEPTSATTIKIYTDGKIGCTEVDVFSDRRIKTDIQDSDPSKDLDTILALRVRDFRYRDPIEHGTTKYTGLVAQEVKEVFPAAVSTHDGVIPDIFQVPSSFSGRLCRFTNKIEGLVPGARVKVLDESVEKFLEVTRVSDFEIEFDSEIEGPKVFVYGQTVQDLHTVSYDRLVPVLISAVQELAKKLERS